MKIKVDIRPATLEEIDQIKKIADANKSDIGFVRRAALVEAQKRDWLIVAIGQKSGKVLGFANIWRRRDGWTTLLEICVLDFYRGYGVGVQLLNSLPRPIQLKCTIDNPANEFYSRVGCKSEGIAKGKKRAF